MKTQMRAPPLCPRADAARASLAARVGALDWPALAVSLDDLSYALAPGLLDRGACRDLAALYDSPCGFRSRVVMARHGFGRGEYKYFDYPLPALVAELRGALYPRLAEIVNIWEARLVTGRVWPARHEALLEDCRAAGQTRPTPLLLRYGAGDFNCLHQDLYGAVHFPLQAAILLNAPGRDFEGGEFALVETRPRQQSRVEIVPLAQGDIVIFPVRDRPREGARGPYRTQLRHGVSSVRRGRRHTLGIIFHDAE